MESGRKGDYFVWDMKLDNELSDVNLYNEAKAFALSVEQNTVEVKYEQDSGKETETPKTQPTNSVKPETEDKSNQDEMPF